MENLSAFLPILSRPGAYSIPTSSLYDTITLSSDVQTNATLPHQMYDTRMLCYHPLPSVVGTCLNFYMVPARNFAVHFPMSISVTSPVVFPNPISPPSLESALP